MLHLLLQQEHKTYSFRESTDGIDTLDVFPDELSLTLAENKHQNIFYNLKEFVHSYQIVSNANKSNLCNNKGLSCHIKVIGNGKHIQGVLYRERAKASQKKRQRQMLAFRWFIWIHFCFRIFLLMCSFCRILRFINSLGCLKMKPFYLSSHLSKLTNSSSIITMHIKVKVVYILTEMFYDVSTPER